ncbi:MAG: flippase-like domain-containing protein [Nanoarchaeota archaeon]|nr:flippase-like domain-containing protein [Nanoarchaeota archaeon]MBU1622599.1 flippase-like domain-containing protein [Nanoarchaeota archaeon]MBU1974695.1 flippase-like domain-containing protein [Nanoarchaeota archaeon]
MNKKIFNYLRLLLGIIIIFFVFYKVGFIKIGQTLAQTELSYLVIAFLFLVISIFLNTINLKIFFNTLNPKIKLYHLFKHFSLARTISMFLPGRLGDFSLIIFLKKYNVDIGRGTAIMLLDKLITFILFSILGIMGIAVLIDLNSIYKPLLALIVLIIITSFFLTTKGRDLIKKYLLRKYAHKFKGFSKTFFSLLKKKRELILLNLVNTILRIVVIGIYIYFIYLSLGIKLGLGIIVLIESIITLVKLLPLTPSGIGLREITGLYLYGIVGIASEVIMARYIIAALLNYSYGLFVVIFFKKSKQAV